jgi:mannose-1-phosphate guanylyltransferase
MLHAVLMAGGSGTRFWPASRRDLPKQLLSFTGSTTMIQATAARLVGLVPEHRQLVVTSANLVDAISEQLPGVNIVGEPCRRDTAPCVGLAAAMVSASDPDATMLVLPSDHVISTDAQFADAVQNGVSLLDEDPSRVVTFGIRPTYAAESFGYIERSESLSGQGGAAYRVARFREKPNAKTAGQYLQQGNFYWNSGIFLWRAATILELLRKHEPAMAAHIDAIGAAVGSPDFKQVMKTEFEKIIGNSIDYAVMERHNNVVVIEAPFQWDDVGSWQAISRLNPVDTAGNTARGLHVGIDTHGSIVFTSPDHAIVTIDIDDLIVVHTPDATLVAPKKSEERVREAVKELEARGLDAFL